MALPSTLANLVPPGEAGLMRRIEDLERQQRETLPALMAAIKPMFAEIRSTVAGLAEQVQRVDALVANQVADGAIGYSTSGYAIPTTAAPVATRTMNIPDGFTKASVMTVVSFGAWNPTATAGYFYGRATIDAVSGAGLPVWVPAGSSGTVTTSAIRSLTGLTPGGQITVSATCNGPSGWGAAASNVVNIDAIAIFRR